MHLRFCLLFWTFLDSKKCNYGCVCELKIPFNTCYVICEVASICLCIYKPSGSLGDCLLVILLLPSLPCGFTTSIRLSDRFKPHPINLSYFHLPTDVPSLFFMAFSMQTGCLWTFLPRATSCHMDDSYSADKYLFHPVTTFSFQSRLSC